MRFFSVVLLTLAIGAPAIAAARPARSRVVRTTVVAQPAGQGQLAIVPFAVPVAVPVAVISQPTALYSYRQHAAPAAETADVDASAALTERPESPPEPDGAISSTVKLLTARCAKCHSGAAPPGHLQIFDAGGQILPRLPRRAIVEMVSPDEAGRQRMPPGDRPRLSAEEVSAVREWAQPPRDLAY